MTKQPIVVCLCGSTRFTNAWKKAYREETLKGKIVLSVGVMLHAGDEPIPSESIEKVLLIDLSHEVLVLDVDGYIGESTKNEIKYAIDKGKPIRYLSRERPNSKTLPKLK